MAAGARGAPANIASVSEPAAAPGAGGTRPWPPPAWPKLVLDSGASHHMVRDASLLSDLRDVPAGRSAVAANGDTTPITKTGHVRVPGFAIPAVRLVPGLGVDGLVSVRQLARESGVGAWFVGDRAMLYAGPDLVGVAVAPEEKPYALYVLQFLRAMPRAAAASSSSSPSSSGHCLDGDMRLQPVWCSSSALRPQLERLRWSQFSPIRVHTRKKLRLPNHMRNELLLHACEAKDDRSRETISVEEKAAHQTRL